MSDQRDLAERFRAMHVPGKPVVLVNVWDAASARIVASLGYEAIATTSAGIAFLEGFPDGERITRETMLAGIARICRAVKLPVTADLEAGYGYSIEEAAATARGAIAAGAVGLNFEDGVPEGNRLADTEWHARRIAAIRHVGEEYGVPLVINARTDAYLQDIGDETGRLADTIARGRAYAQAGADCIFVPGVVDGPTIRALVDGIGAPISVLANANVTIADLAQTGVARISLGSGPMLYAYAEFRELAAGVRERGTIPRAERPITHGQMNALLEKGG